MNSRLYLDICLKYSGRAPSFPLFSQGRSREGGRETSCLKYSQSVDNSSYLRIWVNSSWHNLNRSRNFLIPSESSNLYLYWSDGIHSFLLDIYNFGPSNRKRPNICAESVWYLEYLNRLFFYGLSTFFAKIKIFKKLDDKT